MRSCPMPRSPRVAAAASALTLAGAILAAVLGVARPAAACGGCFSPVPPASPQWVLQNKERVLFAYDAGSKSSTVWIEVRYTGSASEFGWVLPLPKPPKVGVGTSLFFDRLDAVQGRRFVRSWRPAENCRDPQLGCLPLSSAGADASAGDSDSGGGSDFGKPEPAPPKEVKVLDEGKTGPYDYLVVSATDAKPLHDWLKAKGYNTPDAAVPIIASHVAKGDVFVAIKLSNGAGVDKIRPVALTMPDAEPCVPLRLTSIAAQDDMEIIVTLAGPGRAVPKNHLHVELNPLRLALASVSSTSPRPSNYDSVLATAIDEAGGRAFHIEFAGKASADALLGDAALATKELAKVDNVLDLVRFVLERPNGAWRHPDVVDELYVGGQLQQALAPWMPNSAGAALSIMLTCGEYWAQFAWKPPAGKEACLPKGAPVGLSSQVLAGRPFDGVAAAKHLHEKLFDPMTALAKLVAGAERTTRMVMRISPAEMDRDPVFAYSKTLPDVAADVPFEVGDVCSGGWLPADAVRLVVPGHGSWVLGGSGSDWNNANDPRFKGAPAAALISLLDETGAPAAIAKADLALVDEAIKGAKPGAPSLPTALVLKPATAWQAPESEAEVKKLGPWFAPGNCTPKPGWVSGQQAPAGAVPAPLPDIEVVGGDGISSDGGGLSSDGSDPSGAGSGGGASDGGRDGGGCSANLAAGHGLGAGWLLLAALAAAALARRRFGADSRLR